MEHVSPSLPGRRTGRESSGRPERPASRTDVVRVALAGVLWGTGGLTGALLGQISGLSPLAVASYRLLAGGLLLVGLLIVTTGLRGVRIIRRNAAARRRVVVIGALAATYQSCYFAAVAVTTVSLATLLTLGTAPVLVLAADALLRRTSPSRRLLVAVAVALPGLAMLIGSPGAASSTPALLGGCLLALGSAAGFAAITLLGRRPVPGLDPVTTTAFGFSLGGLLLAVLAAPFGLGFHPDPAALALVGYLGLAPTALAYVLYFGGLRTVHAGPAALIVLLEPLTAAVLGAAVLGERLGLLGVTGGALIGAAVALSRRE